MQQTPDVLGKNVRATAQLAPLNHLSPGVGQGLQSEGSGARVGNKKGVPDMQNVEYALGNKLQPLNHIPRKK